MTRTATEVMYQTESLDAFMPDAQRLIQIHYDEIATYKDIPLDPDWDRYRRLEESGGLRIYTVRDGDQRMLAYCLVFLGFHPHYRTSLQANQDVIYVDPEHRGGHIGWRLIDYVEKALRAEGVQAFHQHVKVDHPQLGEMLVKRNYKPTDLIMSLRLDDGH